MTAKDIRWSALKDEFDAGKLSLAVRSGKGPDGLLRKTDMPRRKIGDEALADLITYLKTLP